MVLPTPVSDVIIIAGPTASGKSEYALNLARQIGGEIVNADSAQMYTRISIGTAKPEDWATSDIKHHLFDICDQPVDFDVVQYRDLIIQVVNDIKIRGKKPILVGGSLFYIKSLLFPPCEVKSDASAIPSHIHTMSTAQLWQHLQDVDPLRASQVHMHDTYRIMRALAIWYSTGEKPSTLVPLFKPPFSVSIIFLSPSYEQLCERINARTEIMIKKMGWIDEVRSVMADNAWRELIDKKGFIGYSLIAHWIEAGANEQELPELIEHIQQDTRNYAKRQRTFWRSFQRQLESMNSDQCHIFVK